MEFHIQLPSAWNVAANLKAKSSGKLSVSCGLKVEAAIAPKSQKINVSGIENQQALNAKRYDNVDINDILGGHALDESSAKVLSEPKNDLTMAILKILGTFSQHHPQT